MHWAWQRSCVSDGGMLLGSAVWHLGGHRICRMVRCPALGRHCYPGSWGAACLWGDTDEDTAVVDVWPWQRGVPHVHRTPWLTWARASLLDLWLAA